MLDRLWNMVLYSIPWWVWGVVALVILALLAVIIRNLGGLRKALPILATGLVAVVAGLIHLKGRQAGWNDRGTQEQKRADQTLDRAHEARARAVIRDADPERLREDDGYRRD